MIIDISHHNGELNWDQVAPGIDGVYTKISEGTSFVDPNWIENYAAVTEHNKPIGAYHYADGGNPIVEANHFADVYLSRGPWHLAPTVDAELAALDGQWISRFRDAFRTRVIISQFRVYAPVSMLNSNLDPSGYVDSNVTLWAAEWGPELRFSHPRTVLWQNSDAANVLGFVGDTDQYVNGWTPQVDITGQSHPVNPPSNPPGGKIPPGTYLKVGSTGVNVQLLQSALNRQYPLYSHLRVDGMFGPMTEAVVREFQQRAGLAVDGIAGPLTLGRLYLQG